MPAGLLCCGEPGDDDPTRGWSPMPYVTTVLRFRRVLAAVAALALPALICGAVAPAATEPSAPAAHRSLAGQLLIASPEMRDPRFDHAVVLVVKHDRDGA